MYTENSDKGLNVSGLPLAKPGTTQNEIKTVTHHTYYSDFLKNPIPGVKPTLNTHINKGGKGKTSS